jgi:RimJ/RimL family protein N-acetyltransferase
MIQLEPTQFTSLRPLFREAEAFNLSVKAVLMGSAPGEAWADDAERPTLGFVNTSEGHYVSGDPNRTDLFDDLRATIPDWAFLQVFPAAWARALPRVWVNDVARPHARQHYVLRELRLRDWRERLPAGFEVRRIDAALLGQPWHNLNVITRWIGNNWRSQDDFVANGFGFCVVDAAAQAIVSCCVADCACGDQAEVGIKTDAGYRRRGLASAVVAATVEHALAQGAREVGWHCVASNAGSIATAQKVGFAKERDYVAYNDQLPSENAPDLSPAGYAEWAAHYEQFVADKPVYALHAACARALAGHNAQAIQRLRRALATGERFGADWLLNHWSFAAINHTPEFQAIVAEVRANAHEQS